MTVRRTGTRQRRGDCPSTSRSRFCTEFIPRRWKLRTSGIRQSSSAKRALVAGFMSCDTPLPMWRIVGKPGLVDQIWRRCIPESVVVSPASPKPSHVERPDVGLRYAVV